MPIIMRPGAEYHPKTAVHGSIFQKQNSIINQKSFDMKKYFIPLLFAAATLNAQQWAKQYDFVDDCVCGLAKVSKDGKFGFVNSEGKLIVALEYDEALAFNEGLSAVKKGNKWGYLDSTGKVVSATVYEDAASFHEGLAAVRKDGKYGFIGRDMEVLIPFEYSNTGRFSEGLAAVANSKGQWGYIDVKGGVVINFVYTFADMFNEGVARVMKGSAMKNIDRAGKEVKE